jgi:hypothetical protein
MEALGSRLHAGIGWLTSSIGAYNLSLNVPFIDTQMSTDSSVNVLNDRQRLSDQGEPVIFVDASGRQMSEAEVEALDRAAFSDSPWGFIASRYALTLGIMAVVVNRITHICRPQGRPRPLPTHRRLAIQLPTMLFLAWSAACLLMVTHHAFFRDSNAFGRLLTFRWLPQDVKVLLTSIDSESEIRAANSALLWRLFLSVCLAVISSTLLRTLEGHNTIINPDDLGNSPTFNLVGFALHLHLHASSHSFPPNKNVYLSILFQALEVLGLQTCTCWITPPVTRLTLTSIFGLTSTVHYLVAVISGDREYPFLQSFSRAPDVALIVVILLTVFLHALTAFITSTPLSFSRLIDPRSLPLPTDDYSLALFKVGTACLSSTRLSGLDADMIDIRTSTETWIEVDGTQIRVRKADGSLAKADDGEVGGFANEIRRIRSNNKASADSQYPFRTSAVHERWTFLITLLATMRGLLYWAGRKIAGILPFEVPRITTPRWLYKMMRYVRLAWHGSNGEARRQRRLEERRLAEGRRTAAIDQAERDRLEGAGRAIGTSSAVTAHRAGASAGLRHREDLAVRNLSNASPDSWHRYLQQQHFADDDDDDDAEWREEDSEGEVDASANELILQARRQRSVSPSAAGEYWSQLGTGSSLRTGDAVVVEDDESDAEEEWSDEAEEVGDMSAELLTLARREFDENGEATDVLARDSYARILMAHMSTSNARVLTRRGYRDLVGGFSGRERADAEILADVIRQRRSGQMGSALEGGDSVERERMRLCVICYAEDRTIICWPCKCLALCDPCREAMAARPPPRNSHHGNGANTDVGRSASGGKSTHTCPTCRTPVVGFSRIFLP